jgi:hypothetical protein
MNIIKRKSSTSLNEKILFLTPQTPRMVNNKKLYYIQGTYFLLGPTEPDTGTYGLLPLIIRLVTPTTQRKNLAGESQTLLNTLYYSKGALQAFSLNPKGRKVPHRILKIKKLSMTLTGSQNPLRHVPTPRFQNMNIFMDIGTQIPDQETTSYGGNQSEGNKTTNSRNTNAKVSHTVHRTKIILAWFIINTNNANTAWYINKTSLVPQPRGKSLRCPQEENDDPNTYADSTPHADARSRHNVKHNAITRPSHSLVLEISCTTEQDSLQQCQNKTIK